MSKESEFLAKLKITFKGEAEEHRSAIIAGLLELEKVDRGSDGDSKIIEDIFREVHSLKGAARAVDIKGIEQLCQSTESIFSVLKKNDLKPTAQLFDVLYRTFEVVGSLTDGTVTVSNQEIERALKDLEAQSPVNLSIVTVPSVLWHASEPKNSATRKTPLSLPDSVRLSASSLNSIYLKAEEMLLVNDMMAKHLDELHVLMEKQAEWMHQWQDIRNEIIKHNKKADKAVAFHDIDNSLRLFEDQGNAFKLILGKAGNAASRDCIHAGERVNSLLIEIKAALLQPFSSLLEPFSLMVRNLAVELGKDVTWIVHGDDTRIDRRVLEKIKDPLVHIVRNSISHGIEKPDERVAQGKPSTGIISLEIGRIENGKVELIVQDDGAGIDIAKIKAAAIAKRMINEANAKYMKDEELLDLIFLPEFSTSSLLTVVSGRGLGLAIALENIEMIGGQISVSTTLHKDTTFRIQLPLSLATFRAVLVKCRGRLYAMPTMNVDRVFRTDASSLLSIDNRDSLNIDGRVVALVDLGEILGMGAASDAFREPRHGSVSKGMLVMVLLVAGTQVAYRIDEIEGEQELLAKDLGKQLLRVRNISGAAIIGGGVVIPILNPADLLKSVIQLGYVERGLVTMEQECAVIPSVLVVDDSLTSRLLMKSLLESAGYQVTTAVDGVEAFAFLKEEHFDLLVSDVEMPRMDGFILCEKVRASLKTLDLPIVLVTSKDSPDDRERGVEVGADALVSKSSLDKSNLLGVIKRLL